MKIFQRDLKKEIEEHVKRAYDVGYEAGKLKGYELGYQMRKCEETDRGFIIGTKAERDIKDILEKENF